MMRAILLLVLLAIVHGKQTTPMPPNITVQPTDLLTINDKDTTNVSIVPLPTQGFAVEYAGTVTQPLKTIIYIPCTAVANPQSIEYSWYIWNKDTKEWTALTNSATTRWNNLENGDRINAGMLIIQPYNKVDNAGSYLCRAKSTIAGTAVSRVLTLVAASFPNEGVQASVTQRSVQAGSYLKLDVPMSVTTPSANISWTRTTSRDVPSGSGNEIPADRTQMDERGVIHIGYLDDTLLQVKGVSGTSNYNFYHYKYMSLRYVITDLAIYQLSTTGSVPSTVSCNLQYQTPSLTLLHGQSSRIACVYAGSPNIRVSYFKQVNGKEQQLTTQVVAGGDAALALLQTGLYGNTYMIGFAQTTDAGTYTCSATFSTDGQNVCGGTTVPMKVIVDLEPTFVLQPSPITYVVEGQSITLKWLVKGRPKPSIDIGLDGALMLPTDPNKMQSSEQDSIVDPVDGLPIYSRTFTLFKAIKPIDSHSVQVYANNIYYMAVSSIALTVISPITFPAKMSDQLGLSPNSKATFVCTGYTDDALVPVITWTRFFGGVTFPVADTGAGGQFSIATNDAQAPSGLRVLSQTLIVDTSVGVDLDASRGQYACNMSNIATWSVTSSRLSFIGDDPVAAAAFEMWMLGPILGGVAAIILVIGIIFAVRRNRGEKYEVEDEEIKKGYDPKKEAHEQRELREYQRDREKDAEPLRQSQNAEIEHEEDA